MTEKELDLVREAAALWKENLVYLDNTGNYRWSREFYNRRLGGDLPKIARGASPGKVIPQNKAIRKVVSSGADLPTVPTQRYRTVDLHELAKDLGFADEEYRRGWLAKRRRRRR